MSEAIRLGPEHADLLAELEKSYPPGMQEGVERLKHKLHLLSQTEYSFCWGLFENDILMAYLVAWPQQSRLDDPRAGKVVYIDDLQVTPDRAYDLYQLLKMLTRDLEDVGLAHMHIEAVCRPAVHQIVLDHPQVIRRLGYELLGQYAYWEEAVGEELVWMRWARA